MRSDRFRHGAGLRASGPADIVPVDCDHPAIRGAVIAFMVERSPRPVGSRMKLIVSGSPYTRRPAALPRRWSWPRRASCLLGSRWLLAIRLCLLWQPGGLGRTGGSAPLVAASRAHAELVRAGQLHMHGQRGRPGAEAKATIPGPTRRRPGCRRRNAPLLDSWVRKRSSAEGSASARSCSSGTVSTQARTSISSVLPADT